MKGLEKSLYDSFSKYATGGKKTKADDLWEKYASSNGIPFEYVIWDAQECADYLGISKSRFLRYRRYNEGFPKMVTKEDERPRWRAADVVAWRLGYDRITTVAA